jgi:hypothetical protein
MKESRDPKFTIILGAKGTGKTSDVINIIENKLKSEDNRVIIVNPNDPRLAEYETLDIKKLSKFSGVRCFYVFDIKDFSLLHNYKCGLLILDDCRRYIPDSLPTVINTLFINSRLYMVDIVATAHGFMQIPSGFFFHITEIILHRVKSNPETRKKELGDDYEEILRHYESVMLKSKDNKYYKELISV